MSGTVTHSDNRQVLSTNTVSLQYLQIWSDNGCYYICCGDSVEVVRKESSKKVNGKILSICDVGFVLSDGTFIQLKHINTMSVIKRGKAYKELVRSVQGEVFLWQ